MIASADARRGNLMLVALAALHGAMVLAVPSAPLIAVGLWWNANTISHYFVHRPFFDRRSANAAFAAFLSLLLGFPHALWRDRHLAHHAGVAPRLRCSCELWLQLALVLGLWIVILAHAPMFFLAVYLPGWAAGLCLCAMHGYYEHAHGTTSHYGRLYNLLLFNDGYHVEHHANPVAHWTQLPSHLNVNARTSRWPAPMRWLESDGLIALEHVALRSPAIQRFLLRCHERAFRRLLPELQAFVVESPRIAIVGGGLFPRTAMVLQRLWPSARLTVIDCNAAHLDTARRWPDLGPIEFVHDRFPARVHTASPAFDVVVLPLSFEGSRDALYLAPPARVLLVHDWLWRPRGSSRVVSALLLKRLNFVHI